MDDSLIPRFLYAVISARVDRLSQLTLNDRACHQLQHRNIYNGECTHPCGPVLVASNHM